MLQLISFLDNSLSSIRILRLLIGFFFLVLMGHSAQAQNSMYDEQSILGLQAMMRNRGIQVVFSESASVDVFQLSKKLLEHTPIDCYRLDSEDRILAIENAPEVKIVLKSREWMRISSNKQFICDTILKDFALQIISLDHEQFEIVPDKSEMSKHTKK